MFQNFFVFNYSFKRKYKKKNMYQTSLLQLMKLLSKKELSEAENFFRNKLLKSNQAPIKLFGLIRKYHPQLVHPNLDRNKIFAKLLSR